MDERLTERGHRPRTATAEPAGVPLPSANGMPPRDPNWPKPPSAEAFYGLAGEVVDLIRPTTEADDVAILLQVLVAFGNVVGRNVYFPIEATRHHCNEFLVLVGRSAKSRKGTALGRTEQMLEAVDHDWSSKRCQTGLSSGEGVVHAVRDEVVNVDEDGTEKVIDEGVEDKRLMIVQGEFAGIAKQLERPGNNLSVVLRDAWDGRLLQNMTKNSPMQATGAHISIISHCTRDELGVSLSDVSFANGFGNRYLWAAVDRSKLLPLGGRLEPHALEEMQRKVKAAYDYVLTASNGGPCQAVHNDEARDLWCEKYPHLSRPLPGLTGAMLARSEAHTLRLSLISALMNRSTVIAVEHLEAALAIWDYCERSAWFLFGDKLGDPLADDILKLLRGAPGGLTRTEISGYLGRNKEADQISRALGVLIQHTLAYSKPEETNGRPAERWFAIAKT
jgi:hypothetical protein